MNFIKLNDKGKINFIGGTCKAKDFRKEFEKLREVVKNGS